MFSVGVRSFQKMASLFFFAPLSATGIGGLLISFLWAAAQKAEWRQTVGSPYSLAITPEPSLRAHLSKLAKSATNTKPS